ncbi:MAG: capsular biosynthesis protein [Geobacter sp.]|nr:MAG: capsular biosynthesis protein [Geobacter sp.]
MAKSINANLWEKCFKLSKSFLLIVVVPFLLIAIYYGVIASPRYVSESKITVRQSGGGQDVGSLAVSILSGGGSSSREDNLYLREYILSLDMLQYLDASVGLRKAYQGRGDYLSRLLPWASQEDFLNFYRKHVSVNYDAVTGVLTIRTEAFDRAFARRMNAAIMYQCEKFINDNSHRISNEQLRFISSELTRANEELLATKQKVLAFQNRHNVLDPVEQAKAMSAFVLQLEAEVGRQEAELRNMRTFLAENSTQVVAFREKLGALKQQLQNEKQKISGGPAGKLNTMSSQFMLLQFQAEFALDKYKATLAAYEKERVEASRKVKNLVVISSPHQQEEAEYPRRQYIIFASLVGLLILYGISRLIIATIEDHKD